MEQTKARENKTVAILVPLLVIIAVFLVWYVKTSSQPDIEDIAIESVSDFDLTAGEDIDLDVLFSYNLPVILDFGASWCEPCQLMKPILVKLNEELRDRAIIKYIDIEEITEFSSSYPVTVVPTQFFYNADGSPFVPDEDFPIELIMYELKDTGEHALTAHEGYMDEQSLLLILEKMGMEND